MANVLIDENSMTDIADAIRAKLNTADTYLPSEMAEAIGSISGGADLGTKSITANGTYNASSDDLDGYSSVTVNVSGGTPTGTKEITANGTGIDVAAYAYADVAVPNSYAAGDEGKVVSNGALVAQTSDTVTANDTYDTTLINSLTVNVSGGVTPTGTKEISITQNGTTTEDVTNYASAEITVNVPSLSFSAMTVKIKNGRTSQIAINRVTYNSTTMLSAARANVNVDATVTYTDMATDGQYIFFDSSSGTTVSYNGTTATFNRSSTKFRVKIPDNFDSSIPFVIS